MKLTIIAAIAALTASTAFAGHVQNGFRDTGCDAAAQVRVYNDKGEYLYSLNPTCPEPNGPTALEK